MKPSTFSEFAKQGFSHVPVVREVGADLDTPLSAYLKLANTPYSFLFESVHGGERWGRYSIIGLQCDEVISVRGEEITRTQQGQVVEQLAHADPLSWIEDYRQQFKLPKIAGLPGFIGGL
ncbi:anthranilate synthase component I, partial [Gammaproteobacteria bacterium]|nr:anthranilate synthase component I [Gammaproteobacteria bacterium]